jgi:hypothetical protein
MTRSELNWVLVASLLVLLFASLPTLYAVTLADADHVFTGFVYNTEDGNAYLAKMRLGAEGDWLFHLFYTAEEHEPALAFPLHILLGKLAAVTGLSLVTTYHLARVVLGLFLLLTIYAFVARFTSDVTERRLAWALTAVGSGMGWLLIVLGLSDWLGSLPLDFWVPEAYVFLVLYNLPHLALAEALLLWALIWTLKSHQEQCLAPAIWAGLAGLGMTLVVPFYAGVLAAALGAYLVALSVRERRVPWRQVGQTAVVGALVAPAVLYNAWAFTSIAAFRAWTAQNTILSPHPLHYVLGTLPLIVPAVPGAIQAVRQRERRWLLPVAWVLIVPLLLYAPFNLQRRLIAGVQVPLALLASVGLVGWFKRRARTWRLDLVAWVALAALSNVLLVTTSLVELGDRSPPAFRPAAEVAAMDWLAEHASEDDLVLCAFESGNFLPTRAKVRVFLGHGPETLYREEKEAAARRFFDPATDDAWRQDLIDRYGIDWVFYGPAERELGSWDPAGAPFLLPSYRESGYAIFRVAPQESQP